MSEDKGTPMESLETWLSGKPFWEQYVWKINLQKEALTEKDIDHCYEYLTEHLGLIDPVPGKPKITFKNEISAPEANEIADRLRMAEVKDLKDVNALSEDCSVNFGPNLTLVYGSNGSGKSGIGRLLCNACFSRGDREVLPD